MQPDGLHYFPPIFTLFLMLSESLGGDGGDINACRDFSVFLLQGIQK